MDSLDGLFPNPEDCYFSLFQDAVIEHDKSCNYTLSDGKFVRRNKVPIAKKIVKLADILYGYFVAADNSFSRLIPHTDYMALLTVLGRYSRDIYGCRRIEAKIADIKVHVGN